MTDATEAPISPIDDDEAVDRGPLPQVSESPSLQTVAMAVIATLLLIGFLWMSATITAPVVVGLILGIVLTPVSNTWERLGIRASTGAFLTVLCVLLLIVAMVFVLEPYVTMVINRAPLIWLELKSSIDAMRDMMTGAEELARDMADAVAPEGAAEPEAAGESIVPTVSDALYLAPQVMGSFLIFAGTLYFFLLTRASTYTWAAKRIATLEEDDFRRAERRVSKYLLTITAINATFGVLIVIVMQAIGMSSPIFWGLAAFMLNYLLYLGPIFLGGVLLVAGHVVFDGAMSFAPAAIYLTMNAMEGQFITPTLVGHRMRVNPLAVFLSLVFWMWLWGPVGAIVAIPVLIWCLSIRESGIYGQQQLDADKEAEWLAPVATHHAEATVVVKDGGGEVVPPPGETRLTPAQ